MTVVPWHAHETGGRRVGRRPHRGFVGQLFARAMAALSDRRKRARNRRELAALDDRTLHDLGLSRSDIGYLSSKAGERDGWADSLRFPPL